MNLAQYGLTDTDIKAHVLLSSRPEALVRAYVALNKRLPIYTDGGEIDAMVADMRQLLATWPHGDLASLDEIVAYTTERGHYPDGIPTLLEWRLSRQATGPSVSVTPGAVTVSAGNPLTSVTSWWGRLQPWQQLAIAGAGAWFLLRRRRRGGLL